MAYRCQLEAFRIAIIMIIFLVVTALGAPTCNFNLNLKLPSDAASAAHEPRMPAGAAIGRRHGAKSVTVRVRVGFWTSC